MPSRWYTGRDEQCSYRHSVAYALLDSRTVGGGSSLDFHAKAPGLDRAPLALADTAPVAVDRLAVVVFGLCSLTIVQGV